MPSVYEKLHCILSIVHEVSNSCVLCVHVAVMMFDLAVNSAATCQLTLVLWILKVLVVGNKIKGQRLEKNIANTKRYSRRRTVRAKEYLFISDV